MGFELFFNDIRRKIVKDETAEHLSSPKQNIPEEEITIPSLPPIEGLREPIRITNDIERQQELVAFLSELWKRKSKALSAEEIRNYINRLKNIFIIDGSRFFQLESGALISAMLRIMDLENRNDMLAVEEGEAFISCLRQICKQLLADIPESSLAEKETYICLYNSILNVIDVTTVETRRIALLYRHSQKITEDARNSFALATEQSKEALTQYDEAKEQSVNALKEAHALKADVITILSIFASIIVMFSGGISIFGNAVASLKETLIYKSLIVVLVSVLGLLNGVFLLLYVAGKIGDKDILSRCPHGTCLDGCSKFTKKDKMCCAFMRFKRRIPYLFWMDMLLIIATVGTIVAWGIAEGDLVILCKSVVTKFMKRPAS